MVKFMEHEYVMPKIWWVDGKRYEVTLPEILVSATQGGYITLTTRKLVFTPLPEEKEE